MGKGCCISRKAAAFTGLGLWLASIAFHLTHVGIYSARINDAVELKKKLKSGGGVQSALKNLVESGGQSVGAHKLMENIMAEKETDKISGWYWYELVPCFPKSVSKALRTGETHYEGPVFMCVLNKDLYPGETPEEARKLKSNSDRSFLISPAWLILSTLCSFVGFIFFCISCCCGKSSSDDDDEEEALRETTIITGDQQQQQKGFHPANQGYNPQPMMQPAPQGYGAVSPQPMMQQQPPMMQQQQQQQQAMMQQQQQQQSMMQQQQQQQPMMQQQHPMGQMQQEPMSQGSVSVQQQQSPMIME